MSNRKSILALALFGFLGLAGVHGAAAGVCVWSCQYNSNTDTWTYWFARTLSDCAAKDCLPRNGSSPSGTACSDGSPDIPGDCRDSETDGIDDWLIEGKDGELPPGLTATPDARAAIPCGTCGDSSCSGKAVQSSCTSSSGLPGVCLAIFSGSHPAKCPYGGYQCACLD
jgi:hypothetical protein